MEMINVKKLDSSIDYSVDKKSTVVPKNHLNNDYSASITSIE